jgi:hypothetical protein
LTLFRHRRAGYVLKPRELRTGDLAALQQAITRPKGELAE